MRALPALGALWLLAMGGRGRRTGLTGWRYAHRGLHDLARGIPENSMTALRLAAEGGFAAELDVRLTRDGRLAILHDHSLLRPCGVDLAAEDLTSRDLAHLRLFGTAEKIPLLEEVLPLFAHRPLLIELKTAGGNGPALARALCEALAGHRGPVLAESFDPRALRALRRLRPDLPRGQLAKNFLRDRDVPRPGGLLLTMLWGNCLSRPDFLCYRHGDRRDLPRRLCLRLWGLEDFRWTITTPEALRAAEAEGAAVIFEGFRPSPEKN